MKENFPKVLIINESFNLNGGGITIRNLFSLWPKEKIGNANIIIKKDESICGLYYYLKVGTKLSNLKNDIPGTSQIMFQNSVKDGFIKKLLIGIKNYFEQKYLVNKILIDNNFINWIKKNKFDLIYAVPYVSRDLPFLLRLKRKVEIPLAIHIFDDWVEHNRFGFFTCIFKPLLDKDFRKLIKVSNIRFVISKEMMVAYKQRYNCTFYCFHNPSKDSLSEKCFQIKNNEPCITFVGTIGEHNFELFIELGKALEILNKEKFNVKLRFYGYITKPYIHDILIQFSSIEIKKPVVNDEIKKILINSTVLFLPLSFNRSQKKYIQYSMPTKTAEYMSSGTPILVFAPKGYALTNYALQEKWGYVLTKIDLELLSIALRELFSNLPLRESLSKKARTVFLINHRLDIVSNLFRQTLNENIVHS